MDSQLGHPVALRRNVFPLTNEAIRSMTRGKKESTMFFFLLSALWHPAYANITMPSGTVCAVALTSAISSEELAKQLARDIFGGGLAVSAFQQLTDERFFVHGVIDRHKFRTRVVVDVRLREDQEPLVSWDYE
jgi:hypothetical protein